MRRLHVAVAVVVLVGLTSAAMAQQQRGRGFGQGGAVGLLMMEAVQKELNVTDEQKEKLQALRTDRGSLQNLSREERRNKIQELAKKADESIKTVLDEKQQQRLEELRIQQEGAESLTRPEIAAKLGLDDAQKEKIKKIQADDDAAPRPNRNATQEERQKYFAEARERREKRDAAILAVLKPEQKASFEKMQGEKFEFPRRGRTRNQNTNE